MTGFSYYQPTQIRFGSGRVKEVGTAVSSIGHRCLVVTGSNLPVCSPHLDAVLESLREAGVAATHFSGAVPNPTIESVSRGAALTRREDVHVILGLGGGSSIDTAKAVAVEATHPGTAWDYLYFKQAPTERTPPVIAVPTTSGTGSHVTQVAVLTETATKTKSAIFHVHIYPRLAIVDPDLMSTVPPKVTAATGFDVFAHAFESFIHVAASAYTDLMALEAMRIVGSYLPRAVKDGHDREARQMMALADTLAGLCIANAGVTLPHGIGMAIGGFRPAVMHGEALAAIYPEFTRFTWKCARAKFAAMGRILDRSLDGVEESVAAEGSCSAVDAFLKSIRLATCLEALGVSQAELAPLTASSMVLPDYRNNPRVATSDEILAMLAKSYRGLMQE
jgi:alcohol dehydrogenase class IV